MSDRWCPLVLALGVCSARRDLPLVGRDRWFGADIFILLKNHHRRRRRPTRPPHERSRPGVGYFQILPIPPDPIFHFSTYTPTPWEPLRLGPHAAAVSSSSSRWASRPQPPRRRRRHWRALRHRWPTPSIRQRQRRLRNCVRVSPIRACSPEPNSRKSRFRSAASAPDASASAGAASCATGRSSTGPTRAVARATRFPRFACEHGIREAVRQRAGSAPAAAVSGRVRPRVAQRARPAALAVRATFTGEFPLAHIAFRDRRLPVQRVARRVQPVHPARSGRLGPAGRGAALPRDESAARRPPRLDRLVARESAADVFACRRTRRIRGSTSRGQAPGISKACCMQQPRDADGPSAGRDAGPLGARSRRRTRVDAARLAARALVDQRAALLGRLLGRRRARAGVRRSRTGGCRLPAAHDSRPARRATTRSSSRWHFPEPHARPVRLGLAPEGQGGSAHRQLLLHALRRRLGGGALRGVEHLDGLERARAASPTRSARARCRPPSRTAPRRTSRRSSRRRASAPPTASSTASKAAATTAAAARQLHARLELRDRHAAPVPAASRARCAAPPSATRWTTTAACASASCCRTASSASRRPPPTARWARS